MKPNSNNHQNTCLLLKHQVTPLVSRTCSISPPLMVTNYFKHFKLLSCLQSNQIMGKVLSICRGNPADPTTAEQRFNPPAPQPTRQRKRFNPFFQPNSQTQAELSLQEKYRFVSNYQDRFMGRCTVLQQIESGNLVLCRQMEFKTDAECRELVQRYKQKKQNQEKEESILRILQIFGKRIDGLLKDVSKATAIMEYPLVSIKRQFNNRLLHNVDFQIEQIRNFIQSTIVGYATLERSGCLNDKVRAAHIFMGLQLKESVVKVIDAELIHKPSNFKLMAKKGYRLPQNHDIYLAPEQFSAIAESKQQPPAQDRAKAAVFSLGATILDICIMCSTFEVYHYDEKYMSQQTVKGLINIARKRHGPLLYKLLNQMLEWEPKKRPSFSELEKIMAQPLSQSSLFRSSMRLSTVQLDKSRYLETTRHSGQFGKLTDANMMYHSMAEREFCRGGELVQEEEIQETIHMHQQYIGGSQYIGQKKRDMKHGKGKYIFKDRSYYEGWWKDDMMHGEGQLFFPNGKLEYQGEWAYDQPNGWGVLYAGYESSSPKIWTRYQGEMRNGEMHGRGKIYFIDTTIFQGEFQNGKIFGRGCKIYPNGEIVEKEWRLVSLEAFLNEEESISKLQGRLSASGRNF